MELTKSNYYGREANQEFMSVSQYHELVGTQYSCEARGMAIYDGKWENKTSTPMLVGSYVDAYFDGTLPEFKFLHPKLMTIKGELRAEFKQAEQIIEFAKKDEYFMEIMNGEKQTILTGELFGVKWKARLDVLHSDFIVDLKVIRSIKEKIWTGAGKSTFIDAFDYLSQGAIYQQLVLQKTGKLMPFYLACLTKEENPDKEIIYIDDDTLLSSLIQIELNMPHVIALRNHEEPPVRCGQCEYCRSTKVLKEPISYKDLRDNF